MRPERVKLLHNLLLLLLPLLVEQVASTPNSSLGELRSVWSQANGLSTGNGEWWKQDLCGIVCSHSKANYTITQLTYNSRYWIEIELGGAESQRFWFQTPGCARLAERSFKVCLTPPSDSRTAVTSAGLLMQQNSMSPSFGPWTQSSQLGDGGNPSLVVNVTCLSYDVTLRSVKALVAWQRPVTSSMWNSTVMIRYPTTDGIQTDILRTVASHIQLELKAERISEVTVISKSGNKEVIYETRYVNISRDLAAVCDTGSTAFLTDRVRWSEIHSYGPLTIAVVGISLIAVVVVLIVGLNRCRSTVASRHQSNLEDKTACSLTKSNSYKSSPSGSPCMRKDEQIQMTLQIKDKWEIDAHEVILGVELGQGAFGLVMTGFYQNTQVAIKVLKGDALPSHRDELLREIKLMKQIGHHPNIVTLIGACTICDPIALIMEYMPYGNLQLFLQKCLIEGSVVRGAVTAVQYCPLDQLTGAGDTKWTLASGDMLSFARQIALAMEYLTSHKYVHRDLAARNVLVGADKTVKLCDFGLARLVYSGDQYCKLTNGRLPLKWMALESIRDRVFTAQSDVWSFGVLLWEIATLGASPYANIALVDLYRLLSNGYRLEQPPSCSSELYDIMSQCWCENPAHRPTFSAIREQLEELLSHHRNYLDLDNLGLCPTLSPQYGVAGSTAETAILDSDTDDEFTGIAAGLLPPGAIRSPGTSAAVDENQKKRHGIVVQRMHRFTNDDDVHYLQASDVMLTSSEQEDEHTV